MGQRGPWDKALLPSRPPPGSPSWWMCTFLSRSLLFLGPGDRPGVDTSSRVRAGLSGLVQGNVAMMPCGWREWPLPVPDGQSPTSHTISLAPPVVLGDRLSEPLSGLMETESYDSSVAYFSCNIDRLKRDLGNVWGAATDLGVRTLRLPHPTQALLLARCLLPWPRTPSPGRWTPSSLGSSQLPSSLFQICPSSSILRASEGSLGVLHYPTHLPHTFQSSKVSFDWHVKWTHFFLGADWSPQIRRSVFS